MTTPSTRPPAPLPELQPAPTPAAPSPTVKLAIDYGPLLTFFAVNSLGDRLHPLLVRAGMAADVKNIIVATAAFMAAIIVAVIVSRWKLGRVSPMLWFTAAVITVFGSATLYFHDASFIKIKMTVIYLLFASVLLFGMATGRPLLKTVLGEAFPALDAHGWRKLTRNWIVFFIALAATNEVLRRQLTDDHYVAFKVWGVTAATMLFALAQTPILTRHSVEEDE